MQTHNHAAIFTTPVSEKDARIVYSSGYFPLSTVSSVAPKISFLFWIDSTFLLLTSLEQL